jgi:cyclic lactone autoinducer peptide
MQNTLQIDAENDKVNLHRKSLIRAPKRLMDIVERKEKKMSKFQKVRKAILSVLPALALLVAIGSASATCFAFYHEPGLPEGLKDFDK